MSKFKKNFGTPKENDGQEVTLGTGLLNDVSKSLITEKSEETVYIDMDRIRTNKKNEYSIGDLEELADLIRLGNGIWQNLIVKPMDDEGYYELTTGERRLRAAKMLSERGEYPQKFHNKVPCSIQDPNDINLPLSLENKEMFSILSTNKYRNKTDGDKLMEIRRWKDIFKELRENGIETFPIKQEGMEGDSEENAVGMKIKGVRTRELIANTMGMSTGQVSRFENIEKKGSMAVIESLISNKIDLPTAEKIIDMPKEEQDTFIGENGEHISSDAVNSFNQGKRRKIIVSADELQDDLTGILNRTTKEIELTEREYKTYKKSIAQITRFLDKNGN